MSDPSDPKPTAPRGASASHRDAALRRALWETAAVTARMTAERQALEEVRSSFEADARRLQQALEAETAGADDLQERAKDLEARLGDIDGETEMLKRETFALDAEARSVRRQIARLESEASSIEHELSEDRDTGTAARASFRAMHGTVLRLGYKLQTAGATSRE